MSVSESPTHTRQPGLSTVLIRTPKQCSQSPSHWLSYQLCSHRRLGALLVGSADSWAYCRERAGAVRAHQAKPFGFFVDSIDSVTSGCIRDFLGERGSEHVNLGPCGLV